MTSRILFCTCLLLAISCQSADKKQFESNNQQPITLKEKGECDVMFSFNRQDSTGIFRGRVSGFEDTSSSMSQGLLQLANATDTVIFNFDYDDVQGIVARKLAIGNCVEVSYYAEIQRVEVDSSEDGKRGDEISRHFYISGIKYLN